MDTQTEARVQTLVEDLVEDRKMFTAFDVTKIIRAEVDKGVKVYHSEVRRVVNDMWDTMGQLFDANYYVRIFMTVTGNAKAFVYHNNMDDVCNYDPDALPEKENKDVDDDDLDDDEDNDVLLPDNRGRICVPKKALERIGLKPGDVAYVVVDDDMMIDLYDYYVPNGVKYVVDKSGNVRVSFNKKVIYTVFSDRISLG